MFQKLKDKLDFEIISIQFVERNGLKFLDIELPFNDLKTIEEKTKEISIILDEIDILSDNYYLNVFSSGTEKEINLENINFYLNQNLAIRLSKPYLDVYQWEGILLENNLDYIILQVNNKGRIQKLKILKKDIFYLKTTAKFRKGK